MHLRALPAVALAALLLPACRTAAPPAEPAEAPPPQPEAVEASLAEVGLDQAALDTTVDPCADFYDFACGGWLSSTEIPPERSRWSRSFSEIRERNLTLLRGILDEAAASPGDDPVKRKIGAFYAACMDEDAIEAEGLAPYQDLLDRIAAAEDRDDVVDALIELHRRRIWAGFDVSAEQDFKQATEVIAYFDQNGLSLPDREHYLSDDAHSAALRDTFLSHVVAMDTLAGADAEAAADAATDVMRIETALAEASLDRVTRRDPEALYHKVDRAGLEAVAPGFPWGRYLRRLNLADLQAANVTAPGFFEALDRLLDEVPVSAWRNYLRFHVLDSAAEAEALPEPFVQERFRMIQALTGQETIEPRWKRCVALTDGALGELLGQAFVERAFAGESKTAAQDMALAVSAAFRDNLDTLDWMDAPTREKAKEKLDRLVWKIGHPDTWRTYDFEVSATDHAANVLASAAFELRHDLDKIGEPVDRGEWHMSPATVNAYYNPLLNEMVFPAGILQPPFYDVKAALPVNLGAMGMVVGHELTHGFDDKGSKFAGDGNLRNWWSESVAEAFAAKAQCVIDQYAGYEPLPGLPLNGALTVGENISDIAGIKMAWEAYQRMHDPAAPTLTAGGFGQDQLFFLGFAQSWCSKDRPELTRMLVRTDPHSPARFRVNGALVNSRAFADAFQCAEGAPMRPKVRCEVW